MAFRLCVALGFLAIAIIVAMALRGFLADLLVFVRRSSPWQRGLLAVFAAVFVLFGGDKNDATNPPPAPPPLRLTYHPGALDVSTGDDMGEIPGSMPQFVLPEGYVATNLAFFGFRGGTNVAFALAWPPDDPSRSCNMSIYCNWTLAPGPWLPVDCPYIRRSDTFLVGELQWSGLVEDAVASGEFPSNATDRAFFMAAAWCVDTDGDGLVDSKDPHPLTSDGDFFGPRQTLPAGANADAYCWIDLVAETNAYLAFAGDRASNLPDPDSRALLIGNRTDAYKQVMTIDEDGTSKIEKFGHWLSRGRYCRIILDGVTQQWTHFH